MSYLSKNACRGILESSALVEYLDKRIVIKPTEPKLKRLEGPPPSQPNPSPNPGMSKEEAAKTLLKFTAKILLGHLITLFVDIQLSKFTVNVIRENQKNKRLFKYIKSQVDLVYHKHPDYMSCSAEEFSKSSIFNYMIAEWREKTAKERAKLLAYKSIDSLITIVVSDIVPIPGSSTLAIPVKMVLSYIGVRGIIGSLYNIALEIDGNTISFGVDLRPDGFLLTNLILYTFNPEKKLIGTYLPDPPEHYYQITQDDIDDILDRYGEDSNLDILRKEVK